MTSELFDLETFQAVQAGEGPVLLRLRASFRAAIDAETPVLVVDDGDEERCFAPLAGSVTGRAAPGFAWQGAFVVPAELMAEGTPRFALDVGTLAELPEPTRRTLSAAPRGGASDGVERDKAHREHDRAERALTAMRAAQARATKLDREAASAEARAEAARERAAGLARELESARTTAWRLAALAAEVPRLRRALESGPAEAQSALHAERAEAARRLDAATRSQQEATRRADALEVELHDATTRVEVLVAELERTRAGQLTATSRAEELQRRADELTEELRRRDEDISVLEAATAGPEAQHDVLRERVARLEAQLADHRATRATFVDRLAETERELDVTRTELAEATAEMGRLDEALAEARLAERAAEAGAAEARAQLEDRLGYLQNRLSSVLAREREERERRESLERAMRDDG